MLNIKKYASILFSLMLTAAFMPTGYTNALTLSGESFLSEQTITTDSDAVPGPAAGDISKLKSIDTDSASVKPVMSFSRIELTPEEAKANPVQNVQLSISGAEGHYSTFGFHITYDPRLTFSGVDSISAGEALKEYTSLSSSGMIQIRPIEEGTLFFTGICSKSDDTEGGKDGVMLNVPLAVPSDCQPGDVFPIQIMYQTNATSEDIFTDSRDTNDGKKMGAYLFTKGIIQGYIKIKESQTTTTTTTTTSTANVTTSTTKASTTSLSTTTSTNSSTTTVSPLKYMLGDVNNSSSIDSKDASAILSHYALTATGSKSDLTDAQKLAADVNKDSKIDSIDASCVLSYYSHLSTGGKLSLESFLNGSPASYSIDNYPPYLSKLSEIKALSQNNGSEKNFALTDLNGDGFPELIITVNNNKSIDTHSIYEVYTIVDDLVLRLVHEDNYGSIFSYHLCKNGVISRFESYNMGQGCCYDYYTYSRGTKFEKTESLIYKYTYEDYNTFSGQSTTIYHYNYKTNTQEVITEAEAQKILDKYKRIEYEVKTLDNKKVGVETFSINDYPLYKSQLSFINANSSDYYACLNAEISTHYSYDAEKKYALMDLNGDKKPELIITTSTLGSGAPDIAEIYTISGNKLVRICQGYDRSWYYLCENNVIACSSVYGNGHGMAYYKYNGGSKLDTIEWFNYDYYTGSLVLIYSDGINQKTISESEAQAIQAKYKDIRYELITF